MRTLLVLNGSHSDIPLIRAGKQLGYKVITTGNRPELVGHSYADDHYLVDFSDKDAVLTLAKDLNIDAVCSCANDFGVITASYVAEQMGLPGHDSYEVTQVLHLKNRFKVFALTHGISTPDAESYDSLRDALDVADHHTYPLIVKPVDLTGGKGISVVSSRDRLLAAIEHAFSSSREKKIVLERYIVGSMHSLSTFVQGGKVVFHFSDNEYTYLNPYLITTSAAPATGIEAVKEQLLGEAQKMVDLLSLTDGVFHIQYIQQDGYAWIIEITRRCSGDFYPYPVNYASGLDWAEWLVRAECGMDCSSFPSVAQRGFCGRHCIMSHRNGVVDAVNIDESLKRHIFDEFMMWEKGDVIDDYLTHKLGVLFLRYDSEDEMMRVTQNITNLVSVELEVA